MPDVRYTHQKLGEGIAILVKHPGRIKERLTEAFHHSLHAVDANAFSEPGIDTSARPYWDKVWAAVTTAPHDAQLGVYGPSIEKLTEKEASELAHMIYSVDSMVEYWLDRVVSSVGIRRQ